MIAGLTLRCCYFRLFPETIKCADRVRSFPRPPGLKSVSYGVNFIEKIRAQSPLGRATVNVCQQVADLGMGGLNDGD